MYWYFVEVLIPIQKCPPPYYLPFDPILVVQALSNLSSDANPKLISSIAAQRPPMDIVRETQCVNRTPPVLIFLKVLGPGSVVRIGHRLSLAEVTSSYENSASSARALFVFSRPQYGVVRLAKETGMSWNIGIVGRRNQASLL